MAWFVRDIWHKYHSWHFKTVPNFTSPIAREIRYNNFEISLVVFLPKIYSNKLFPDNIRLFPLCVIRCSPDFLNIGIPFSLVVRWWILNGSSLNFKGRGIPLSQLLHAKNREQGNCMCKLHKQKYKITRNINDLHWNKTFSCERRFSALQTTGMPI